MKTQSLYREEEGREGVLKSGEWHGLAPEEALVILSISRRYLETRTETFSSFLNITFIGVSFLVLFYNYSDLLWYISFLSFYVKICHLHICMCANIHTHSHLKNKIPKLGSHYTCWDFFSFVLNVLCAH